MSCGGDGGNIGVAAGRQKGPNHHEKVMFYFHEKMVAHSSLPSIAVREKPRKTALNLYKYTTFYGNAYLFFKVVLRTLPEKHAAKLCSLVS